MHLSGAALGAFPAWRWEAGQELEEAQGSEDAGWHSKPRLSLTAAHRSCTQGSAPCVSVVLGSACLAKLGSRGPVPGEQQCHEQWGLCCLQSCCLLVAQLRNAAAAPPHLSPQLHVSKLMVFHKETLCSLTKLSFDLFCWWWCCFPLFYLLFPRLFFATIEEKKRQNNNNKNKTQIIEGYKRCPVVRCFCF